MSWGWLERKSRDTGEWSGFLERGVKIEGRLESKGTLRLDSTMKGTLVSDETLVLGEHALVEGQIVGNCVIIRGRFDGIIRARGKVEIHLNAIVTGEVHTPCLIIEPGAIFDGQCHMLTATEAATPITIPIRSAAGRGAA